MQVIWESNLSHICLISIVVKLDISYSELVKASLASKCIFISVSIVHVCNIFCCFCLIFSIIIIGNVNLLLLSIDSL